MQPADSASTSTQVLSLLFMAQAMPSLESATHLWSLSTLTCSSSCVLPLVMSYSFLYSPPLSCRPPTLTTGALIIKRGATTSPKEDNWKPVEKESKIFYCACSFSPLGQVLIECD